MEVVSQAPHERQLDLLLHELEATVDNCCWEGHGNKAGNAVQEAIIILQDIRCLRPSQPVSEEPKKCL